MRMSCMRSSCRTVGMPLADRFAPLGPRPVWRSELLPLFEEMVLDVLVQAYERLRASGRLRVTWTENRLSRALLFFIDEVADEQRLPFFAHDEARLLDDDEASLDDNPDEAVRIDLAVRHSGMRRPEYYGVEAKVLTSKTLGSRRPGASVSAYVAEGIARFANGSYAAGHPSAAMIGYLVAGDAAALVASINAELGKCRQLLRRASSIGSFLDHFASEHDCPKGPILLHHLFFMVWV